MQAQQWGGRAIPMNRFDDATLSNQPIDDATLSNQLWIEDFPIHGLRCKAKLSNQRIEDPKWIPNRIIID